MTSVPIEEMAIGSMGTSSPEAAAAKSQTNDQPDDDELGDSDEFIDINTIAVKTSTPVELADEESPAMELSRADVKRATEKIGLIHTSFPECLDADFTFDGIGPFPVAYRQLTGKERLLLLFAENYRHQFGRRYVSRRPPVLALPNECGVQKFVSTTIRPTYTMHADLLTGSWPAIAAFVADFIHFEPLPDPVNMPQRLMSPATLLRRRLGNSYELATLLVSLLVANGFRRSYLVSGYASREVCSNDQRRVDCPNIPVGPIVPPEVIPEKSANKYALKDPPDMRSTFLQELERRAALQAQSAERRQAEDLAEERKLAEQLEPDPEHGKRMHAWVVVLIPIVTVVKPTKTSGDTEAEELITEEASADAPGDVEPNAKPPSFETVFIEPSTGFAFEPTDNRYLGIECAWNHENYYVNRQEPITDVANIRFNFADTRDWEHLLPGEPAEQRVDCPIPDDVDGLTYEEDVLKEKHLDMPCSWVDQLHIGIREFESRYPNSTKVIHYMRAIYERYAPYHKKNGMVARLTVYYELDYTQALRRWEWYKNRQDLLQVIAIDYENKKLEEYFVKGRPDCLKYYTHSSVQDEERTFQFYHVPRLDALMRLDVHPLYIKQYYGERKDRLYYREFRNKERTHKMVGPKNLIFIQDKFHRNAAKEADRDMAVRNFDLQGNTISIQFQYAENAITASTRMFIKPPKPDYECEILFDPECTKAYNCNPSDIEISHVEQYLLLLEVLAAEDANRVAFEAVCQLVDTLLSTRKTQMSKPRLTFNLFDPMRNNAPRQMRLAKLEDQTRHNQLALISKADFLSPYMVRFQHARPSHQESVDILAACLADMRADFLQQLNELQRRYDEHVSEALHFKRFLKKFHEQFDEYDYERLIEEGEAIEVNKRMIQQRLIATRASAQSKYEKVRQALLADGRLGLRPEYREAELRKAGAMEY